MGLAKLKKAGLMLRHMGPTWCLFRARYALRKRFGWMERACPSKEWEDVSAQTYLPEKLQSPENYWQYRKEEAPRFFFNPGERLTWSSSWNGWDSDADAGAVEKAEEIWKGRFSLFSTITKDAGFPPNWHLNQISGEVAPSDLHWSRLSDFSFGDIKNIWEINRFAFSYDLVRAYWRTGDPRHAETFWLLFEDWVEKNPPQRGVNWKCGQEIALRLMAWSFALYGFGEAEATTPGRVVRLAKVVYVSAMRIEANLDYALSQDSNHGHTETFGLYLAGTLFPELIGSERWRKRGRVLLEELVRDLNYADGNSCMNSMNYQRMMMEILVWAVRLGELHGEPLNAVVKERMAAAAEFFFQCQDPARGHVPNYGSNDGAFIFPVTNCDYQDYRPIAQLLSVLATGRRIYGEGPWDEALLWTVGQEGLRIPMEKKTRKDFASEPSGFYVLRSGDTSAIMRCGLHRHRPGHADMLHADIWWKGRNLAMDAGTFSYNGGEVFDNALRKTRFHNTVTVDGVDQMESMGRFLWLPWVKGHLLGSGAMAGGKVRYVIGEHSGYKRLHSPVTHQRAVLIYEEDTIFVLDRLRATTNHRYSLHWLLADSGWKQVSGDRLEQEGHNNSGLRLTWGSSVPYSNSLVRAQEGGPRGWISEYYQQRAPAFSLSVDNEGEEVWFWSVFSESDVELKLKEGHLAGAVGTEHVSFALAQPEVTLPVLSVTVGGSTEKIDPSVTHHRES